MEKKGERKGFGFKTAGVIWIIMGIGLIGFSWYMARVQGWYEEELAALGPIFLSMGIWFFLGGFRPEEQLDFRSKWRLLISLIGPVGWFFIFLALVGAIWFDRFLGE